MKKERGITLIALVITIIVMLILVGVTIRISSTGNLFKHAANAVSETKKAIETENAILDGKITIGNVTYNSLDEYVESLTLVPHYGDANLDGNVDITDFPVINQFINGTAVPTPQHRINSDVDLNGVIEQRDIQVISAYLMGKIPGLPYTGELP